MTTDYNPTEVPLVPQITIDDRPGLTVCNTCGTEDGTVRCLSLRWSDPSWRPRHGGGTAVALCRTCRVAVRDLLAKETP